MERAFRWLKSKHQDNGIERVEEDLLSAGNILTVAGWAAGAAIAIGAATVSLRAIPPLQDKVATHETRLTVLEAKFDDIKSDTNEIKDILRGHRSR